ncbi:MAG: hypothetical protein ABI601_12680 [bacterium]
MTDPAKVIIVLSAFGTLTYIIRFIAQQFRPDHRHAPMRAALSDAHDERLARIEQAVESIAIEVERISEGQRFTTKLLAERAQADQIRLGDAPVSERRPSSSH